MDNLLRVAVAGAGVFGRHHARLYRDLQQEGGVELAAIVDSDLSRGRALALEIEQSRPGNAIQTFGSVRDLLAAAAPIHACSVAVPTVAHLEVARALMEAGADVLIEKPLATSLAEADELVRIAQRTGRIAQTGHLERFNPAVRATLSLLTQPMFFEVHRLSIFTPRSLDVDVVLDLMIHDLDIVLSFVNSPVKEIRAVGLPIISGKVDIANVRMEFDSGCVANFTASRVSTEKVRKLRFFQPHQYVSVDYSRQDVFAFSISPAETAHDFSLIQTAEAGAHLPGVKVIRPEVQHEEPLRAELRSFLDAVRSRSKPVVNLADGRRALEVALDINSAIREHTRRLPADVLARAW